MIHVVAFTTGFILGHMSTYKIPIDMRDFYFERFGFWRYVAIQVAPFLLCWGAWSFLINRVFHATTTMADVPGWIIGVSWRHIDFRGLWKRLKKAAGSLAARRIVVVRLGGAIGAPGGA